MLKKIKLILLLLLSLTLVGCSDRVPDAPPSKDPPEEGGGGAPEELISRYFGFIDEIRGCARLKFYLALAYLRTGDLSSAKEIINEKFEMADIKEGELSISALWRELYDEDTPIPDRLNFVMKE